MLKFSLFCYMARSSIQLTFCLSLLLSISGNCWGVQNSVTDHLVVIDYGIYKIVEATESIVDTESPTGNRTEGDSINHVQLMFQTTNIPATLGTVFGLRVKLPFHMINSVKSLHVSYQFPQMTNLEGRSYSAYEYDLNLVLNDGLFEGGLMYTLSKDYEVVEGEWIFTISDGEKELLRKFFWLTIPG